MMLLCPANGRDQLLVQRLSRLILTATRALRPVRRIPKWHTAQQGLVPGLSGPLGRASVQLQDSLMRSVTQPNWISVAMHGTHVLVRCSRADFAHDHHVQQLYLYLREVLATSGQPVVLDLGRVSNCDTMLVSTILAAMRRARECGVPLAVRGSPVLGSWLRLCRVESMIVSPVDPWFVVNAATCRPLPVTSRRRLRLDRTTAARRRARSARSSIASLQLCAATVTALVILSGLALLRASGYSLVGA